MIGVVDYGMGNLRSVTNALAELGASTELVSDPARVHHFERLIIPGVGAFGQAIAAIRESGMAAALNRFRASGHPVLGVCLGMQLMCRTSEEDGLHHGLDWFEARVVPLPRNQGYKVPHMGWNALELTGKCPLLEGIEQGSDVYFVHSYYVKCDRPHDVLATTDYGVSFASIIARENIYGMQFHPEKSQSIGLQLLSNFLRAPALC